MLLSERQGRNIIEMVCHAGLANREGYAGGTVGSFWASLQIYEEIIVVYHLLLVLLLIPLGVLHELLSHDEHLFLAMAKPFPGLLLFHETSSLIRFCILLIYDSAGNIP